MGNKIIAMLLVILFASCNNVSTIQETSVPSANDEFPSKIISVKIDKLIEQINAKKKFKITIETTAYVGVYKMDFNYGNENTLFSYHVISNDISKKDSTALFESFKKYSCLISPYANKKFSMDNYNFYPTCGHLFLDAQQKKDVEELYKFLINGK